MATLRWAVRGAGCGLALAAAVVAVVGCAEETPRQAPVPRSATTTTSVVFGLDGSEVDPADLDAIAAGIQERARSATLDATTVGLLVRVQLQAMGVSPDQAACVANRMPSLEGKGLGPVTGLSGIPPEAFTGCVDPSALQPGASPDFGSVPPSELRSALSGVLASVWASSGLEPDEVSCMVDAAVSSAEDAELPAMLSSPEPAGATTREVIGGCLTAERAHQLAGSG